MADLAGKRVLVMGLGRFGGGVGVTRWLARQGADVTVTDLAEPDVLADALQQIADLSVTLHLGGHREADFERADLVVANPAVPMDSRFLQIARKRGVPITSEICLFTEQCPARIIGITGTVGKSTTAAMTAHLLNRACEKGLGSWPKAWLGGNIGGSLLDHLERIGPEDLVVLELSSFQLEHLGRAGWSPYVALLTNLAPNHLDRHKTFAAYVAAKLNILRYQDPQRNHLIVCDEDRTLREQVMRLLGDLHMVWRYGLDEQGRARVLREFGAGEPTEHDVHAIWEDFRSPLPGRHNALNAAGAFAVGIALGLDAGAFGDLLEGFQALPHRLELVRRYRGARYYNDSKATTPEAAMRALEAFEEPVIAIVGGYDKKVDLREFAAALAARSKAVICIGQVRETLAKQILESRGSRGKPIVKSAEQLPEAVHLAAQLAEPGEVVLLSPGCASYDMFVNYEQRGEAFRQIVAQWS